MEINQQIGFKIRGFRKKLGLQAKKLAEQLSISASYLNLIDLLFYSCILLQFIGNTILSGIICVTQNKILFKPKIENLRYLSKVFTN